jgi:hypothetical protein
MVATSNFQVFGLRYWVVWYAQIASAMTVSELCSDSRVKGFYGCRVIYV